MQLLTPEGQSPQAWKPQPQDALGSQVPENWSRQWLGRQTSGPRE